MQGQQENKSLEQRAGSYRITHQQFAKIYDLAYKMQEDEKRKVEKERRRAEEERIRLSGVNRVGKDIQAPEIHSNGDGKFDSSVLYNEKYMSDMRIEDKAYIYRALKKIVGPKDISSLRVIGRMGYNAASSIGRGTLSFAKGALDFTKGLLFSPTMYRKHPVFSYNIGLYGMQMRLFWIREQHLEHVYAGVGFSCFNKCLFVGSGIATAIAYYASDPNGSSSAYRYIGYAFLASSAIVGANIMSILYELSRAGGKGIYESFSDARNQLNEEKKKEVKNP